jgi:hypothetical protein
VDIKPIRITRLDDLPADEAVRGLQQRFARLAAQINEKYRDLYGGAETGADAIALLNVVSDFLSVMKEIDQEYGCDQLLPLEDAAEATDQALRCLAELESWLQRLDLVPRRSDLHAIVLGIGFWAMRHECQILSAEPIVNALAERANAAASRQEVAAVYGMMQGFIEMFQPALGADLERSNPQRPWRLLNLNFAISGIRSGDEMLMRFAFAKLNENLPDERAGFYAEAQQLAEQAGLPEAVQAVVRGEFLKWTKAH